MRSLTTLARVPWLLALLLVCGACGAGNARVTANTRGAPAIRVAGNTRVPAATRVSGSTRGVGHFATASSDRAGGVSRAGQPVDPTTFNPGACVAFSPPSSTRGLTVFLDAGHGGRDPGAVGRTASGRTIYEDDQTLAVELDAMALLRAAGFRVVVSRTRDSSVLRLRADDVSGRLMTIDGSHEDVLARDLCANDAHANLLVGIYFDAGAAYNAGSVTGYDRVRPFAAENLRLAKRLQADVLAAMNAKGWGIPNEGVQTDTGLGSALNSQALSYGHLVLLGPAERGYVSTPSRMPGALIEPLFITDPFEGSIAASRHGQAVIARGLTKAIEQYFAARS
jgi:N-acetylmuramoyl-L-alanine amidase